MKNWFKYFFLTLALLAGQIFAYPVGSAPASTPWATPTPGAVWVTYNAVSDPTTRYNKINDPVTNNFTAQLVQQWDVATLKIATINVSANYVANGQPVTVSYLLTNTGVNTLSGINPSLNFFTSNINGATRNADFTVQRIAPAGSYALAPGASTLNVFLVTPLSTRQPGVVAVDGRLDSTPGDWRWTITAIAADYFSGATSINYLFSAPATLNLSPIEIISPNGAANNLDKTLSAGQDFTISFNIQQLGESVLSGPFTATINWRGYDYSVPYVIGNTVTFNLNAGIPAGSNLLLAVSITAVGLTDTTLSLPIGVTNSPQVITLNIVNPAALVIDNLSVISGNIPVSPTDVFMAYQNGPVTVSMLVRNTGGAGATINVSASDLGFLVSNNIQTGTYQISVPQSTVYVASNNNTVFVDYVITKLGGGAGLCTINVTLNAYDENSLYLVTAGYSQAKYIVSSNADVRIEWIKVIPEYFNSSTTVVVALRGETNDPITVLPNPSDIGIITNNIDVTVSFNVTLIAPLSSFLIADNTTLHYITYNVSVRPGAGAVDSVYEFIVNDDHPGANKSGFPVFLDGDRVTTGVLDRTPPELVAATANINNIPKLLTAPTDNFYLILEFSETMNVNTTPVVTFTSTVPITPFATGTWLTDHIFQSAPMVIPAYSGYVTVNLQGGAKDLAGNIVAVSPSFVVFYVDAIPPTGSIEIDGKPVTVTPSVTVNLTYWDNRSASNDMQFMILSSSDVSVNPGVTLDMWLDYAPTFSIELDTNALGTKNIYVLFRDEAGNISQIVSDNIIFDSNEIVWLYPTPNGIINKNSDLLIRAPLITETQIAFYVSVNGTLTLIDNRAANPFNGVVTGSLQSYAFSTTNAELIAMVTKNGVSITGNVLPITIDNVTPTITVDLPVLNAFNVAYVNGTVTISGTATDNGQITAVGRVELSINGGTSIIVNGTDVWDYQWTVPPSDLVPTTYNMTAISYDLAGNASSAKIFYLVKADATPNVTLISPTPNTWLDNNFPFTGTVSSLLPIRSMSIVFTGSDAVNNPIPLSGGSIPVTLTYPNWNVWFIANPTDVIDATGHPATLTVTVETDTNPPFIFNYNFPYRVDAVAPVTASVPTGIVPAVGTYNFTGSFFDAHSGISAIGVSVNGDTSFTIIVTNSATFSYSIPVNAEFVTVSLIAWDNAYPAPNTSNIHTFVVSRDYSLLPTAAVTAPISPNIYVNNTMNITGTAKVVSGNVQTVWIRFTSDTGTSSDWITANCTPLNSSAVNWTCVWRVPTPDAHGTTYNVEARVLSSTNVDAEVSPNSLIIYERDIYGPAVSFLNLADGMYLDPAQYPSGIMVGALTHTDGARVSESYFVVGTQRFRMTKNGFITGSGDDVSWEYFWDFISFSGNMQTLSIHSVDTIGNPSDPFTINVRTVPSVIITDPLPPSGMIDASTLNSSVYATSVNYVLFENFTPGSALTIYSSIVGDAFGAPVIVTPVEDPPASGIFRVPLTSGVPTETVYMINIIEQDGARVTVHYKPVMFDNTPPTINVIFDGVTRYYPSAVISPKEHFTVNVIDRSQNGKRGSGFNYNPAFDFITDNVLAAGSIQRSVYDGGTTTNNVITDTTFDPYTEQLRFKVALPQGTYDLAVFAVDNAGNPVSLNAADEPVPFTVLDLIVDRDATGESGTLDKSKLISVYPNPYDPNDYKINGGNVLFTYYLKDSAQRARIIVYNQIGEMIHGITVDSVGQEGTHAGYNQVGWDGLDKFGRVISNGVYIYMIVIDGDKGQTFHKGTMAVIKK